MTYNRYPSAGTSERASQEAAAPRGLQARVGRGFRGPPQAPALFRLPGKLAAGQLPRGGAASPRGARPRTRGVRAPGRVRPAPPLQPLGCAPSPAAAPGPPGRRPPNAPHHNSSLPRPPRDSGSPASARPLAVFALWAGPPPPLARPIGRHRRQSPAPGYFLDSAGMGSK